MANEVVDPDLGPEDTRMHVNSDDAILEFDESKGIVGSSNTLMKPLRIGEVTSHADEIAAALAERERERQTVECELCGHTEHLACWLHAEHGALWLCAVCCYRLNVGWAIIGPASFAQALKDGRVTLDSLREEAQRLAEEYDTP